MSELSVSKLKLFKACRRAYQLKYVEGLVPVTEADALKTGRKYHEMLEKIYRGEDPWDAGRDHSREAAMSMAYVKYVMPHIPELAAAEEWKESEFWLDITLVGRVDGITPDGHIVEHKTTSLTPGEYFYNLQMDEQSLMYMYLTGARTAYFTVCRKPTIRQKKGESEEEFFHRMVEWYDEDTAQKINSFLISRTDNEINEYIEECFSLAREMKSSECVFYRNTCHCRAWGRECEYAPVCKHYDPNQQYIGFEKRKESGNNEKSFFS